MTVLVSASVTEAVDVSDRNRANALEIEVAMLAADDRLRTLAAVLVMKSAIVEADDVAIR